MIAGYRQGKGKGLPPYKKKEGKEPVLSLGGKTGKKDQERGGRRVEGVGIRGMFPGKGSTASLDIPENPYGEKHSQKGLG